jgi:hypothetical protein
VLRKLLANDKILVFYISYKIELIFAHVFNLVYVVCQKYVVLYLFNSILLLETKKIIYLKKNRTNRSNPNRIGSIWFGLDCILKVN